MNYIIKNEERHSPLSVYRGILVAIVMMFLITPLFQFGHSFSTELTDAVISVSNLDTGSSAESIISKNLILTMSYDNEMKEEDKTFLINNWKTININETTGGIAGFDDVYKYSLNFFMLIVLSILTIFLLFFIAIQMAKRVMEIALLKIIGPFCCTGLTNHHSKSFETWTKSTMGLFLITVVQFVSIGLLLNMFGSSISENGTLTGIFLIIGALLFIISTPTLISSLLGQQSGMMTGFGDIQSLMAIGHGVTSGISIAKAGTLGALSLGSNVIKNNSNIIPKGIPNVFSNKSQLNTDQLNQVRESIGNHNFWKAQQQVKNYTNDNLGLSNNLNYHNSSFTPFGLNYNPIKNQYMRQYENKFNNKFDRK